MQIEVTGSEFVLKAIEDIMNKLKSDDIKVYLGNKMIEVINKIATENLIENDDYIAHNKMKIVDEGILIYNDVQNDNGEYYSLIVEYGSGIYSVVPGKDSHTSIYEKTGGLYWYVPEEQASKLAKYNYEAVETDNGDILYRVFAQYPNYIYTDAVSVINRKLKSWVKEYLTGL